MKDFDKWNAVKKITEEKNRPLYDNGDIWMMSLGENVGDEENGKGKIFLRPVLVIRKFNANFFLGIPLSTTEKEGEFYFKFQFKNKISNALISQVRAFDAKRFAYRMGSIGMEKLGEIKQKTKNLIS